MASRLVLRSWPTWALAPFLVVAAGLWPGFAVAGHSYGGFAAEQLTTATMMMVWVIGLACLDQLRTPRGRLLGAVRQAGASVNPAFLEVGTGLGASASTALVTALVALVHLTTGHPDSDWPRSFEAATVGWLGGTSLLLWSLIWCRWVPRAVLLVTGLLALLVVLSPAVLETQALGRVLRPLFFPVSPLSMASDDLDESAVAAKWFLSAVLHDLGLLVLLFALATSRRLTTPRQPGGAGAEPRTLNRAVARPDEDRHPE